MYITGFAIYGEGLKQYFILEINEGCLRIVKNSPFEEKLKNVDDKYFSRETRININVR